jgi:AraC-like DNA-binding protein
MDSSRQSGEPSHTLTSVYQVFRQARRQGLTDGELRDLTGIAPESLGHSGDRLPAERLFEVWERVVRRLDDPAFPVRVARQAASDPRSPVTLLALASSSVRDGFERYVAYSAAFTTAYRPRVEPWPDGLVVVLDGLRGGRLGERCEAEFELADIVAILRAGLRRHVTPVRVSFAHAAPRATSLHRRHFGPGLRFGERRTELVLSSAVLGLPVHTARPGLAAFLERTLEPARTRPAEASSFALLTRSVLARRLAAGAVSVGDVARELHVSTRTLHRRLAAEAATFRELLDETRHGLAVELLARPELPTAEVAARLGFSSERSFGRAFVRWTGTTPRGRRRRS